MSHTEIAFRPISGTLGAEVSDVDLRSVDDATFERR